MYRRIITLSSHQSATPDIDISFSIKNINVQFPEGWLNDRSLILAGLIKEAKHFDAAAYKLTID